MSSTLIDDFKTKFDLDDCLCTLQTASKDSANERCLSDSTTLVINFDKVKERYCRTLTKSTESMASVDALFESKGRLFFVEFKSKVSKQEKIRIKRKASDSILLFLDVVNKRLSEFRTQAEFVLVYGNATCKAGADESTTAHDEETAPQHSGMDAFEKSMGALAGSPIIKFEMGSLQGVHFAAVHTLDENEFRAFLSQHPIESITLRRARPPRPSASRRGGRFRGFSRAPGT